MLNLLSSHVRVNCHTSTSSIALSQRIGVMMLLILAAFSWSQPLLASAKQQAVVINLAGKQRMLTQKMSKESLLVALQIDSKANAAQLAETTALFDKTLTGLKVGDATLGLPATSSKRTLRQLDKVSALWAEIKPNFDAIATGKAVDATQISSIAEKNIPLLKAMNRAVMMYEKKLSKSGGVASDATAINLSGKQRMLTQKMTKECLLIAYGYQTQDNQVNLLDTYSLFERTLKGLVSGDDVLGLPGTTNAEILTQLKIVEELWIEFKPLVKKIADDGKADQSTLSAIADNNLPLLKEMNKAVKLFEKLN